MKFPKIENFGKRIGMSVAGVMIGAVCVAFFKVAAFGVDPFQSLMSGLDQLIPIDFGTLYMIVNAVLLLFSLIADRHYIGLATFVNLFLLGYVTEFSLNFLRTMPLFAIATVTLPVRVACLIFGVVVMCFGSALYMTADLGVSTYDAIALVCSYKWKLGKFKYVRICTDLVCVILGAVCFLLGGGKVADIPAFIGIGTIITAFFMGPMIEFFNVHCARPFLNGKSAAEKK